MAAEPLLVLTCKASDYDASAHVCAAPFYSEQGGGFLPPLTIADAQQIGFAIALLWAIAFGLRMARRALHEIG